MSYKVYLDAGHGGYDSGATYNGRKEKDDNLRLAQAVEALLRERGIDVEMTRDTDIYQSPNEKAQIANDDNADLFISFHRNSSPVPNTYQGVETSVYDAGGIKMLFANNINKELEKVGFQNLGVDINKNLAVLKRTKMPALLLDVGFINTDKDNKIFDEKFNEVAKAIADGIYMTLEQIDKERLPEIEYRIQVGLFRNKDNAVNLKKVLDGLGFEANVVPMGGLTAVLVGKYKSLAEAKIEEEKLKNEGYETSILQM